jgi:hypothetical protein
MDPSEAGTLRIGIDQNCFQAGTEDGKLTTKRIKVG